MHEKDRAKPAFGGRLKVDDYYQRVNTIISTMRQAASSLSDIATVLNGAELTTPRGYQWDRMRLNGYIRNMNI
jgi:hypothetical protein